MLVALKSDPCEKRDGLGVWLRLPGLEDPVPLQEEIDWTRPRLCAQVCRWIFIGTIGESGSVGAYLLVPLVTGDAGSGGGVKITGECLAILVELSTFCLGRRRAR